MRLPDKKGHFGQFGGRYVPETVMAALSELEEAYQHLSEDGQFLAELDAYLKNYVGRPTPLYFAAGLSERLGAKIYLKREDLCHTGSHKANNALGQALLAKKMGKTRIIAETGAGQHGVATATVAALLGLDCCIYMGQKDMERQALNVFRMKLLGAKVVPVLSGSQTLKDAINEAMRDWIGSLENTHYLIGSVVGPHPYPLMVRNFQTVIGEETKKQIRGKEGRLPDFILACVGGGSNSIGIFYPFLETQVELIGIEAGGGGLGPGRHGASLTRGSKGVLHGSLSYILQDKWGQVLETHSISAGLDYPGVGPEHSYLKEKGRVKYETVSDRQALEAFQLLSETEGILPALESAHALAYLKKMNLSPENLMVVNLSGRGDKDVEVVKEALGEKSE